MPGDASPNGERIIFQKLLIPDIFSEILRYVGKKDRLNLRICSHAVEEAVAQSDIHVIPRYAFDSTMHISGACNGLTLSIRGILTLRAGHDSHSVNAMIRARKRLFKRAFVDTIKINEVDYNIVKIDQIKKLLKGCICKEVVITIRPEDVNEFIREQCARVRLLLKGCMLDAETLLSLNRTSEISINPNMSLRYDTCMINKVSASVLLQLIRRDHEKLSVPVDFATGQSILDVIKAVAQKDGKQAVELFVISEIVDEFLLLVGIRRNPNKRRSNFSLELNGDYFNEFLDEAHPWRGNFKLFYFERDFCKVQICVADRDMD